MQDIKLKVARTAHIFLMGEPGPHIKRFVIACHGYGDSAEIFCRKFKHIDDGQTLVAVPKALSSFYFVNPSDKNANPFFNSKPGASWMTSHGRAEEIEDYCNYLEQVHDYFVPQLHTEARITLLGFSQGGVTALRFAALRKPVFHNYVNWASDWPHDLDYDDCREFLNQKNITWVLPKEDQFLQGGRLVKVRDFIEKAGVKFTEISTEGPHRVNEDALKKLAENW